MSTLDAAFAFAEMGDRSRSIADDLYLNVAGVGDELLHVDIAVAEGLCGLGLATGEGRINLVEGANGSHPTATAPGDRLDHHGPIGQQRGEEGAGVFEAGGSRVPARTGTSCSSASARAWSLSPKSSNVAA